MTVKPVAPGALQVTERYELHEVLGRGGMACVYRATDRNSRRDVALKQLTASAPNGESTRVFTLFEREFHTLAQLEHPNVIAVYDYGVMPDGSPFYTMELLDGGDLRERAPLPWRQASGLLFEVCSSLGLLHSRRLLHRDITPRNIRCTNDGHAKLIDFGAMAHMSTGGTDVVGTPAFVAPETVHRLALDARTDLYSLGVTLYYTLTGNLPYPAASFADVLAAWGGKVRPPSSWVKDIPVALDDLVLALISVEPALRPASAFEVMQRLAALAGLSARESDAVGAAYLNTPTLVGRDAALERFRSQLVSARLSRGGSTVIEGEAGMGRSRFLNACVLEAKTLGFTVLRATASGARAQLAVASDLNEHLVEALPGFDGARVAPELFIAADSEGAVPAAQQRLRKPSELSASRPQLQKAIVRLWSSVSRDKPLLIAVDDVHRIDQESAAVLADLLERSTRGRIFVLLSADPAEPSVTAATLMRRTQVHKLEPFTREQMRALLESLFGDVPNLDMLAGELHEITAGNPGRSVDLAQQLVDRGVVRYEAGSWTLPRRLAADDLPRSAADALALRIAQLSEHARALAQLHALAFEPRLRDRDYRALLGGKRELAERAVAELLSCGAVRSDGSEYFLSSQLWSTALEQSVQPRQRAALHGQLAELYRESSQIAFIYHAFAGELDEQGLVALVALNDGLAKRSDHEAIVNQNVAKMMQCYPRAFAAAERFGKSARFINELRRWNLGGSVMLDDVGYPASATLWRQQLERDCGLDLYRADLDTSDAMARLMRALTGAQERYAATPEAERVYNVEEAIKLMAEYVVYCIAVGARLQNPELIASLPALLEPFAVLSPALDAIWNNARATKESTVDANMERARGLWHGVLQKLDALDGNELPWVSAIANAVAFGIGMMEAQMALPSASALAERLDRDPYQKVSALQLRRILRLEQGDFAGAERLRRQAEIVALQTRVAPMFRLLLAIELAASTKARDLGGLQQTLEQIRAVAAQHRGWAPTLLIAEASFHSVRGDLEEAERKCRKCLELTAPRSDGVHLNVLTYLTISALLSEVLLSMGRAQEAYAVAKEVLDRRAAVGGEVLAEVIIAYALAAASLGMPDAVPRLEALIAHQNELGATGLRMGEAYEARARIAIWQRDAAAFERYAELTAREYRYGADSPLGARYDRLRNEAVRQGLHATASLSDFATSNDAYSTVLGTELYSTMVRELAGLDRVEQRAATVLQLICAAHNAQNAQLYLVRGEELLLSASRGELPAQPELSALQAFVKGKMERAAARAAAIEEMETGEMVDEDLLGDVPEDSSLALGSCRYELLLLAMRNEDAQEAVGVALVEHTHVTIDPARQAQLLGLFAEQLSAK